MLIPTIYSKPETDSMIDKIDKTTPICKRDNAVILLALRLGMRKGNIVNLKFESKRLQFIQEKTDVPQNLFLPCDVELALNEYIQIARFTICFFNCKSTGCLDIRNASLPGHF